MMTLVTDDPFAAAAASAHRITALTGPQDAAVILGSGWAPAADAIGTAERSEEHTSELQSLV